MLPIEPREVLIVMHACKRKIPFDIRLTRFHKIGALLASAHKENLLQYKVPHKKNNKLVVSVNRAHERYLEQVPIVNKPVFPKPSRAETEYPRIEYVSVVIPTDGLRQFLYEGFSLAQGFYLKSELDQCMREYCGQKLLSCEDGAFQMVNTELSQVLELPEMECHKAKV